MTHSQSIALSLVALSFAFVGCGPPKGYRAAEMAYANGEYQKAIDLFTEVAKTSDNPAIYGNRANCYSSLGDLESALKDYAIGIEKATEATGDANDPSLAYFYYNRGYAYENSGKFEQAIADYEKTISINDSYPDAKNNLGWLLATCPVEEFRNPTRAVQIATLECESSDWTDGYALDTLAAAHAAAGNYREAVDRQAQAIKLIEDEATQKRLKERLRLYEQRRPFVESPQDR